ncbi:sensor histidine kinase [Kitasatospora sp. NPDC048407]|uniref:sensor histidine kinase n=1 Tax=Kitasatospora sp. NPDC048407 TaxID=3364051 RepID=UPI00372071EE
MAATRRAITRACRPAARLSPAAADSLPAVLLLLHILTTRAPRELPAAAALTAALALPLARRRRAPAAVFCAVTCAALAQWLTGIQLPADAALLIALYTVAAHTGPLGTLAAATVMEAGAVLACARWASPGAFWTLLAAATATVVAATVLGVNRRTTRAHLAALHERATRLEDQHDQQARLAVAEERARITRDMHDIVTHNLSVMVALTDAAVHAQHRAPDKATTAMLRVCETGRQALTDMRRSLGLLHTDDTDDTDAHRHPLPGITQLATLAEQMDAAGLPTRLDLHGDHTHLPATAQLTVHRLVQEALTNTLKHTPTGTRAHVRVDCAAHTVTVHITDNGPHPTRHRPGTPPPRPGTGIAPPGHGITGMRERAAAYGATLRAGPLPGGGWEVHTRLHLDTTRPGTA